MDGHRAGWPHGDPAIATTRIVQQLGHGQGTQLADAVHCIRPADDQLDRAGDLVSRAAGWLFTADRLNRSTSAMKADWCFHRSLMVDTRPTRWNGGGLRPTSAATARCDRKLRTGRSIKS